MKHEETKMGRVYYVQGEGLVYSFAHGIAHVTLLCGDDLTKEELESFDFLPVSYSVDFHRDVTNGMI